MVQFSLEESHIAFLEQYERHGFEDQSDVVRAALDRLHLTLVQQQQLCESAILYAEIYENDDETQEWTNATFLNKGSCDGGND